MLAQTIIDPARKWEVDPERFASKSRNSPFAGWTLTGRAETVMPTVHLPQSQSASAVRRHF